MFSIDYRIDPAMTFCRNIQEHDASSMPMKKPLCPDKSSHSAVGHCT
jgi:hypothetical protein